MPFKELVSSLVMLILPTALGMWIRWRWVKAAKIMEKIIVPFTLLVIIIRHCINLIILPNSPVLLGLCSPMIFV